MSLADRYPMPMTDGDALLAVAIDDYRAYDSLALVGLLAARSGARPGLAGRILGGPEEKPLALLARAADLGWEAYQAILFERDRRDAKRPRALVGALKLYRDMSRDRARGMLGMLSTTH
jgi:hypothetical protein